jgi:TP901 family phage tail tape measure protein
VATKLEKLFFTVGLIDKASGGVNKITAQIDQLQQRATKGMQNVMAGGAGLIGTGFALKSMLAPSIEMSKALGTVESLDVNEKALGKLSRQALKYSMQYGESAAEFVRASYDVQSAIAGLTGDELSAFTQASGVLAKATKADAGTITNYMGTMYGIFQNQAKAMGKENWANVLAGQTATAVQMFKTTGADMSAAFTTIGADATKAGFGMNEQMAILGTLQATMSGSEAGTKYKAFLSGVGKAQDTLALKFTDSQGKMLPMIEILNRIKGKFGDIDTVAKSDLLKKAFGTKEAVSMVKLLMTDTNGLAANIDKLGNVKGMDKATHMAMKNTNVWDRVGKSIEAVSIVFGQALQPALDPVLESMASMSATLVDWTERYPAVTKYIGIATLAVFGLVAAVSAFALIGGIAQLAMAGWGTVTLLFSAGMGVFNAVLATARVLMIGFAFASAVASAPIWAIVAAVVAAGVAITALIVYWDQLKAMVMDSDAFKAIAVLFGFSGGDAPGAPSLNSTGTTPAAGSGGSLINQVSSATANNQSSVHVEKIEMNGTDKNGYDLADELAMAAG